MRCFYHQDKEAVGTCKSCGKGVCAECAIARAIIQLIDRNIQSSTAVTRVQLAPQPPSPGASQPSYSVDYVAARLSGHMRSARQIWWGAGLLCAGIGGILAVAGFMGQTALYALVGACLILFGISALVQAGRSGREPRVPETKTK